LFKDIQLVVYVVSFSLFCHSASKTEKSSLCKEFANKLKVAYFQCFRVVICIENPRAPAAAPRVAIPGRGTIIQKALHENAGLF
jgi:hypothetical protein